MILIIYLMSLLMIFIAQFFPLQYQICITAQGIALMLFGIALECKKNNKSNL